MIRLRVFSLLFCLTLLAGCARVGGQPAQYTFNEPALLSNRVILSQSVMPVGKVLTAVDVIALQVDSTIDPDGILTLRVSNEDNIVTGTSTLEGSDLSTGWVTFHFVPPVPVSPITHLNFTWAGTTKLALGINSTPAGADPADHPVHNPYADGNASSDGNPLPGDLAFRLAGKSSPGAAVNQLWVTFSTWISRLLGFLPFTTVWLVSVGVSAGLIVYGFSRQQR